MQQLHVFFSGTVQGVGFRQFIRYVARKQRVTGWIMNLPDGRVEAVFQGEKKSIEHVITVGKTRWKLAKVEKVEEQWEEGIEVFQEFSIRK